MCHIPLAIKKVKVNPGHYFTNPGISQVFDVTVQDDRVNRSWRRRVLKVLPYRHGGHLCHVTQLICLNFHICSPISFHMKFGFK